MKLVNNKALVKLFGKAVGSENILASPLDLVAYSYDATGKGARPDLVIFPTTTAQVAAVMKVAHQNRVPVLARGAGTNLTGGTIPTQGGIILELSRMNRIVEIDTARQRAIVEPGVVNLDLQNALSPLGYMYAPDPASQKSCTMGGNLGEDAGGPHCLKYGVTSNHILAIELVLYNGDVVQVGTPTDDNCGYDLVAPLIASEGTLGIATRMTVRIMRLPESALTMLAVFDTLEDAGQAVSDIIAAGIVPGALELLDNPAIRAIEASFHVGYPVDAEALLLIELDGVKEGLPQPAEKVMTICKLNKAREIKQARTAAERDGLWRGRKGAFGAVARVRPAYAVQDATVPRNKLVPMLREVSRIGKKYNILIANVAHAGDGNLHPLLMFDNRDPEETARVEKAGHEILAACIPLEGSISGEHGIGLEKLSSMPLMFTQMEMELMGRVKRVFDPIDIVNPGKKIPPEILKLSEQTLKQPAEPPPKISILDELVRVLGPNNVPAEHQFLASYEIDGKTPTLTAFPANIDHIASATKIASRDGLPIIPWGNGSKQHIGAPLKENGIILSLKHMNRLLELDAPNLTAEVEAGMNYSELQKELAKHGLFFPLEPEDMAIATIGGSLSANSSGPSRLLYGTARDLVLRVTAVTPQGEIVRFGGKTMKNVSGYDLRKLYIGSWGTLGVIARAVLRLSYLSEEHKTLMVKFDSIEGVAALAKTIFDSFLRPESMELIDAGAARGPGANFQMKNGELLLLIGVAGSKEIVERHVNDIKAMAEANKASSFSVLSGADEKEAWANQRRVKLSSVAGMLKGKAVVPINATKALYQEVQRIASQNRLRAGVSGRLGNGILYPIFFDTHPTSQLTAARKLVESAARLGGFFVVESGPMEVRQAHDLCRTRSDHDLMKRLKSAFDPKNIFNPGKVIREL